MAMVRILFTGWRLLTTVLVLIGALVLCGLGTWQLNRLAQRLARNDQINARMAQSPVLLDGTPIDAAALDYRPVIVRGTFDPSQEVVLRNRSYNGATGYDVLTPLRISGSERAVLVDRGWIPLTQASPEARRQFAPPAGEVVITGIARRSQEDAAGPQDPPTGPDRPRLDAWFQVNIPRIQEQTGYPLLPVFVELQPAPDAPPLPARSATTDIGPGPHLSYAIQWFSFAIILVVGYIGLLRHRMREASGSRRLGADDRRSYG